MQKKTGNQDEAIKIEQEIKMLKLDTSFVLYLKNPTLMFRKINPIHFINK